MTCDEFKTAKHKALTLLSQRALLSTQLRQKLHMQGFSPSTIEQVLTFCEESGFLNDSDLLQSKVQRELKKGKGGLFIRQKIRTLGLPCPPIDPDEEHQALLKNIPENHRNLPFDQKTKLIRSLLRKGFAQESILKILRES